ncbi:hypothetical protein ACHAW6_011663, partial [Cyclotella cf. meneghiniana]
DVEDSLKDYFITKINRQPTKKDLSKLKLELSEGLASIPTLNGGGLHGHIGLIIPNAKYTTFWHGNAPYDILDNPGPYPSTVDPDALIPLDPITHLEDVGGVVDYMDVTELQAELTTPWDQIKAPTTLFEQGDKVQKQLEKAVIKVQPELRLAMSLCWFQQSGEFDYALDNWETKPAAQKTFSKFCVFIQKEFVKRTKRDRQTAKSSGCGIANIAAKQEAELNALAMAEFVNAVCKAMHTWKR